MIDKYRKFLRRGAAGALLSAAMFAPPLASAEVLFTETFDYPAGDLYPQGGWLRTANNVNPIQVTDLGLSHEGFLSGNAIKLKATHLEDQDVMHPCVPRTDDAVVTPIPTGDIYVGMLFNVQALPSAKSYFFNLISTNSTGLMADQISFAGQHGYVIINPTQTDGKFKLAIHKNSNTVETTSTSEELDVNTTYFLVLHWAYTEGINNDIFEAWINPTSTKTEPTIQATTNKGDPSKGFVGIGISQFSNKSPEMLVGPIKVATTWDELFDNGGTTVDPDPVDPADKAEINATLNMPGYFALYQYQSYPVTLNVKATGLTEDITVSGLGSAVTASATTIPAADAMSGQGYDLTLTLNSTTGDPIDETLTLTSGETQATVPVKVQYVSPVNTLMNFRFASSAEPWENYYFSGNASVTYVDTKTQKMYMQDPVGGIVVGYEYLDLSASPFKAGDKISKLYLTAEEPVNGIPSFQLSSYFTPDGAGYGTLVAENEFKAPAEMTLAELNENLESYINRLVKVSDLTFTESNAEKMFATSVTPVTSGEAKGNVRAFPGTDLIGTVLPEQATVTGIVTGIAADGSPIISVRAAADVETPAEAAALEVEPTLLVEPTEYYPINAETPYATLKVKATNMAKSTTVWLGGKQRDSFIADVTEIPAGTGEYTINITFKPTATGRHEATINFDATPTELSSALSLKALAYDPGNLPEFTVDNSAIKPFNAAAGTTEEQTLTIDAKNLLDFGKVRVLGQSDGAFRINNNTFLKNGATTIKVTFAPTAEGTFTETIEFSSPKAETRTITVTGTTSGGAPEEPKQGDELSFDTTSPLAQYATGFDNSGENNKPLSLDGWKNVAVEGTRAFWSYTDEGNTMAKVTAYDSTVDETAGTPAEMLLLSPALDYANSASRLLQFSIKGDMLTDDMTDKFSVVYIDPTLPENERYQEIGGMEIPASADAAGQWRDYILDLEGLDLADTFFIGFLYQSTRGRNTSAVYYVDNFSWGSTTTPFIRVDKTLATTTATVGESVAVDEFTVTGMNLTEKIAIAFEGADKDNFTLSATELPAEGGKFTVNYAPAEAGQHAVYVTLRSEGAPAVYITVGGTAEQSGIDAISADAATGAVYYNLQGRRVYKPAPGSIYIRVAGGKATRIAL